MTCPYCHTLCDVSDVFCHFCGAPLYQKAKPKKGSLLIPAIILILLFVSGLVLFFTTASPSNSKSAAPSANKTCFNLYDGTLYFDGTYYTGGSELTVPTNVNGQTVRSLSEGCFAGSTALTTVILPDTLISIGNRAFAGCSNMRGIYIPESVLFIGEEAFSGCSGLEAIYLHSGLKSIQTGTFGRCDNLKYIYFDGTYKQWQSLYSEQINDTVCIFCTDGSFYQGENRY